MPSREEMIKFLEAKKAESAQTAQTPSREEMISFLQNKIKEEAEPTVGDKALQTVGKVASAIDSVTGAPTRAFIGAAQDGENPFTAFGEQFAEDPSLAPSGAEIAKKAGVSDEAFTEFTGTQAKQLADLAGRYGGAPGLALKHLAEQAPQEMIDKTYKPTPADIVGVGVDIAADPTMLIPGKAIMKGAELIGDTSRVAKSTVGRGLVSAADKVGDALKTTTVRAGSALTGVPEKSIKTYIEQTKAVDKIIAKHGGDMTLAADELRENLQRAIQNKIFSLNSEIKKAIDTAPVGSTTSNEAIIKAMEHVKSGINPNLYPDQIKEIDELVKKVKSVSEDPIYLEKIGKGVDTQDFNALNASAANDAKRFLQGMAEGSYIKGGQLFTSSKEAAKAAKSGARAARKAEMQLAPGTIEPNQELSRLHKYEDNVNKNLIAPGKTESALLSAGSGANARNAKNLKDISDMTGFDALGEAERLASAKTFGEPSFTPIDTTGKTAARMGLAAAAGSLIGGPVGAAISVAFTSPAVLKKAIQAGDVSADIVRRLAKSSGEITDATIKKAVEFSKSKEGQRIIRSGIAAKQIAIDRPKGFPRAAEEEEMTAESKPQKGFDKWVTEGSEKLQKHDSSLSKEVIKKLQGTPKGKELLAQASSVSPGSKAMESILKKIKTSYLQGGE